MAGPSIRVAGLPNTYILGSSVTAEVHVVLSAPVNDPLEVAALAEAGAGELYCGMQEAWWVERYGDHDSVSRRQGRANLASRKELAETAIEARKHGLPLFLALNGRYDEHQLDYLVELADAFEEMGGSGVIAQDLGLFLRLKERGNGLKRVCSILAVCANAQSVMAYARLGVSRVVFPRFLGADEIGTILEACAREGVRMEAESMVFFDKCPMVDGYCSHYHGVSYPDRMGVDAELPGEPLYVFDTTYRTHACLGKSCDYLEPYPCAACELGRLERSGVSFGKLGGRGRSIDERVRVLRFLHAAQGMTGDKSRAELYEKTFGQPCACYYGKSIQSRTAIEPVGIADDHGRVIVGDYRDGSLLRASIRQLSAMGSKETGNANGRTQVTLAIGPLPQSELEPSRWAETLRLLCRAIFASRCSDVSLCANDVGTLVALTRSRDCVVRSLGPGWIGSIDVAVGPLLTRGDRPAEFEHFLSSGENPPRPVWDLEGRPRMLYHRSIKGELTVTDEGQVSDHPPYLLWDHWSRQMDFGERISYRRALEFVAGEGRDEGSLAHRPSE